VGECGLPVDVTGLVHTNNEVLVGNVNLGELSLNGVPATSVVVVDVPRFVHSVHGSVVTNGDVGECSLNLYIVLKLVQNHTNIFPLHDK
jgi:hypothetical protein